MPTLTPQNLKNLADKINDAIEDYSVNLHKQEPRTHLGISEIGGSCTRQTWYKFRWMKFEEFDGRMLRLFNRGHREEERFTSYLEGIGCKVERFDENGKQFRVKGVMGHYGGSCDGRIVTPWYPDVKMLVEFKTHNTKSFLNYLDNDKQLHKAKPKHLDQMNGYGYMMQLEYGVYFPENKNDDDINVTVVKLDWQRGAELERRAADIITSQEPPAKISDNPSYYECRYCTFKGICHEGEMPVKNCRSCRLCKPVENAEWYCSRYNANIPKEWISIGCKDGWVPL